LAPAHFLLHPPKPEALFKTLTESNHRPKTTLTDRKQLKLVIHNYNPR